MTCYTPITGWRSRQRNDDTKKRGIVFNPTEGYSDQKVKIPCGKCIGCRLDHARQWSIRIMHEAKMHKDNFVLTLTYNDENLPDRGELSKIHVQKFLKRLRKHLDKEETKIKYFVAGEYGEDYGRPHYHMIIFGWYPSDALLHGKSPTGHDLFTSEKIKEIWQMGHCAINELNLESANYVARYIVKKLNTDRDKEFGDGKYQEFVLMSRGGRGGRGIGFDYWDKYKKEIKKYDHVPITKKSGDHLTVTTPRYYSNLINEEDKLLHDRLKYRRKKLSEQKGEMSDDALRTHQIIKSIKLRNLKRSLEEKKL